MKRPTTQLTMPLVLASLLASASLPAAVPLRWTVETSRVQPAVFEAYQGETLTFEAVLQSYGKPITNALQDVRIYWQTNGMSSAYWSASASADGNILRATWTPSMDVGARVYNCFIGSPSNIYHAAFQLRLRPSPGATPNALPLPTPVIDFARVRVLNPPWPTVETDPTVPAWAKQANPPVVDAYTKEQTDTMLANKLSFTDEGGMTVINGPIKAQDVFDSYGNYLSQMLDKADKEEVNEAKATANEAKAWSSATYNFMTGGRTNCWFSGTNYVFGADAATRRKFVWENGMDAATVPCSMALFEIREGVRECVWDQRDWTAWYWSFKAAQMEASVQGRIDALGNSVTNAANYAWAKRYASDGTPNPDASTTFIDTPSVTLSPGMKWETVATVSGAAYWTIVGNGAVIGGSGTNATLQIKDFEGNEIMTVTKGEHRLAWLESGDFTGQTTDGDGWVCFDMLADVEPVGYFSTTLDSSDFLPQTDPNCPAQYSWENIGGGKYRIHFLLKPGIQANACFSKFQVEVEGQTIIRYNAGQEISGGLIYNGVKIAPDISGSPAVGTVIQWKVVR